MCREHFPWQISSNYPSAQVNQILKPWGLRFDYTRIENLCTTGNIMRTQISLQKGLTLPPYNYLEIQLGSQQSDLSWQVYSCQWQKKNKGKRFDVLEIKAQKINRMERLLKKFSLLFSLSRRIQFTYQFLSFLFIFYALLKFSYISYHIFNHQDYHYCHRKWVFLFKEK